MRTWARITRGPLPSCASGGEPARPPAAARLAPRGGTDASGGGQGGRQGITLLKAYTGAGGCHRRPVYARGEPESAALPPLPLPAGDPRAEPRRARHGAARPLPAPLRPQRVGGLGARGGGRRRCPPPPPVRRRRAQAAPRVPALAPQEEGAASPGGRRCRARLEPAARHAPRVPGAPVSATPERAVGEPGTAGGRGFSCRGGKSVSRSRLPVPRPPQPPGGAAPEPCWQTAAPVWMSNSQPVPGAGGGCLAQTSLLRAAGVCEWLVLVYSSGLALCSRFLDVIEEEDERQGLDSTLLQRSP